MNDPPELASGAVRRLKTIQAEFNGSAAGGKRVSLADLIVLAGVRGGGEGRRGRRPRR